MFSCSILLLKRKDGQEYKVYSKNCILYHLPMDDSIHLELIVVLNGLFCFVCGGRNGLLLYYYVINGNVDDI